mgnify:CR=1 FL=1
MLFASFIGILTKWSRSWSQQGLAFMWSPQKHKIDLVKSIASSIMKYTVCMSADSTIIEGKIPLRQLVYRVLELPLSMRPLVYDFGHLNTKNENVYDSKKSCELFILCACYVLTLIVLVILVVQANSSSFSTHCLSCKCAGMVSRIYEEAWSKAWIE